MAIVSLPEGKYFQFPWVLLGIRQTWHLSGGGSNSPEGLHVYFTLEGQKPWAGGKVLGF